LSQKLARIVQLARSVSGRAILLGPHNPTSTGIFTVALCFTQRCRRHASGAFPLFRGHKSGGCQQKVDTVNGFSVFDFENVVGVTFVGNSMRDRLFFGDGRL
jgi:hypothetical protein